MPKYSDMTELPPPLKTYDEAAAWLGVNKRWLQRQVQANRVPYTRLGRYVRFRQSHLEAICAARDFVPPATTPWPGMANVRPISRKKADHFASGPPAADI